MSNYHPDVRLRHHERPVQIALNYDLSISLCPNASIIGVDGTEMGHLVGHTYRVATTDPDYPALLRLLDAAYRDHYAALDLRDPDPTDLPPHLNQEQP